MRRCLLIIIVLLCVCFTQAQYTSADAEWRKRIDSLKALLTPQQPDTSKTHLYIQIGDAYQRIANDSGFIFYQLAFRLAVKIGYTKGEIVARSETAEFLLTKNDYAAALDLYLKNIDMAQQSGESEKLFYDTWSVGVIYSRIENYEKEYEYVRKLEALTNSGGYKDSVLKLYKLMVINRLGGVFENLNKLDSAKIYKRWTYNNGLARQNWQAVALGAGGLADIYRKQNVPDSSFYYNRICLQASLKANRPDVFNDGLLGMGRLFWEAKKLDSSLYYAQKAFTLSKDKKSMFLLTMIDAAALLADIYNAKKQPDSAYKYLRISTQLKDSLFNSEQLAKTQNIGLKQSLQNIQLEQSKKEAVQQYTSRVKIYSLLGGLVVLLIILVILYRNNRQRAFANKKIEIAYDELKSTQQQLIQKEKMASLGELTSGIAHEIQNPLNFVKNFSEVSAEEIDELEKAAMEGDREEVRVIAADMRSNLQKVLYHGQRADSIVKSMLQHSRASSGDKQPIDINTLVDNYLRLCFQGIRAKDKSFTAAVDTRFDNSIGQVTVVPQDIGRVLLNLFNNAFYAVNEKKKQLNGTYEPTVFVSTQKEGNNIMITVKDNGTGMSQKVAEKVFQPFFTTKPTGEGTGLGLSLSYDIITKGHSGELIVETKEGEYAEFIIQLPL